MSIILLYLPVILTGFLAQFWQIKGDYISHKATKYQLALNATNFINIWSQFLYIVLFVLITLGIKITCRNVNKIAHRKLMEVTGRDFTVIKFLSTVNLKTFNLIKLTSQIFLVPVTLHVTSNVIGAIFSLYQLFSLLTKSNATTDQFMFSLLMNTWLPGSAFVIFVLVHCCTSTVKESEGVEKSLRDVLSKNLNDKLRKRLRIFMAQIHHSRTGFSCGLFEFDWKVIGMVRRGKNYRIFLTFFSYFSALEFWWNIWL